MNEALEGGRWNVSGLHVSRAVISARETLRVSRRRRRSSSNRCPALRAIDKIDYRISRVGPDRLEGYDWEEVALQSATTAVAIISPAPTPAVTMAVYSDTCSPNQ